MAADQFAHRERFLKALNHQEADRVPIAFGGPECSIHKLAHRSLMEKLGILEVASAPILDSILQIVEPDEYLFTRFDIDVRWVVPTESPVRWGPDLETYVDDFGRLFKFGGGFYNQIGFPLQKGSLEELKQFRFPDLPAEMHLAALAEKACRLNDLGYGLVADGPWGIYEVSSSLRGTQELFIDLALNPKYAEALADRVLEEHLKPLYASLLKTVGDKVQMVVVSDDLGSQEGLLFSPKTFRSIYKPRLQRLVEHIRSLTSARIYLHSDGAVAGLIPDFIEAGLDGLNPIQYTARGMGSDYLKREYGKDLGFFGGGVENQIMSSGTPEDVHREVERQMHTLAPGGGYVFATIHNISQEVPPENIIAFFEAGLEFGLFGQN